MPGDVSAPVMEPTRGASSKVTRPVPQPKSRTDLLLGKRHSRRDGLRHRMGQRHTAIREIPGRRGLIKMFIP